MWATCWTWCNIYFEVPVSLRSVPWTTSFAQLYCLSGMRSPIFSSGNDAMGLHRAWRSVFHFSLLSLVLLSILNFGPLYLCLFTLPNILAQCGLRSELTVSHWSYFWLFRKLHNEYVRINNGLSFDHCALIYPHIYGTIICPIHLPSLAPSTVFPTSCSLLPLS